MQDYQREFITFALENKALLFGSFTLKSGRVSPYFFNSGLFNTGKALARLGQFYARAIEAAGVEFDMLFGPAYKGIPLASAVAIAFAEKYGRNLPYCFDRKEAKTYGEGGWLVGAPLSGRVLIIDDVVSAGVTSRQVFKAINDTEGATVGGIAIALDRSERSKSRQSALQELRDQHGISTVSIITLNHLLMYLAEQSDDASANALEQMRAYQASYGSNYSLRSWE